MSVHIVLASKSEIRAQLLRNAGLSVEAIPARIDEQSVKASLESEGASPRDIADSLAEAKARKISGKVGGQTVLGCDQVLTHDRRLFSKPEQPQDAIDQLTALQGHPHHLLSAAVLYVDGRPQWRHVGKVTLHMRALSTQFVTEYVERNWDSIRHSVGSYKLEEEGVRLFTRVEGDYFNVLGLPLLELLNHLTLRGDLDS